MKIHNKIVAIITISLIIYGAISLTLQYMYLKPEFEKVSNTIAQKDMLKTMEIINNELIHVSLLAKDYTIWDQSYSFVNGSNPIYPTEHIADSAMTTAGLSLIVYYNDKNELYYGKWRKENQDWKPLDRTSLQTYQTYLTQTNESAKGLIRLDNVLYLVAIEPILHTDASGPATGKIIFGKTFNSIFTEQLLSTLELSVLLHIPQQEPSEVINYATELFQTHSKDVIYGESNGIPYALKSINTNATNGYSFYSDLLNHQVLLVQTTTKKTITILGLKFGYFSILSIGTCGLLIALLLIIFLRKVIIVPLEALSTMVKSFNLKDMHFNTNEILTHRTDEIGQLAQNIHEMAQIVIEKHHEILNLNESLDAKINERTKALAAANESLLLSDNVLNETSEGILIVDTQMKILRANDAFLKMMRYRRDELIGNSPLLFKSDYHSEKFYQQIWHEVHSLSHWSGEFWAKRKDESFYPTLLSINVIKNNKNQITHYVGLASDITHLKETELALERLAYFDSLTELPNRELFHDRLNQSIKRTLRSNGTTALLFLDLDRFKTINDTLGHATGDEVLIEVSNRIKNRIRESDTVSRLGGDEFTIILENINDEQNAKNIADDLISLIGTPIPTSNRMVNISASVGIALIPLDDVTVDGLMRKADAAMYIAKETGRSRTCFSSKEIEIRNQENLETEARLRIAVIEGEFELFLQPKVKVKGDNFVVSGAEALIRWKTSEGRMIPPDLFISVAEETGLIHPIGKWVLEEACHQLNQLSQLGISLPISVNLSIKQLERDNLLDEIKDIFNTHHISPQMIQFELTESLFMKDFQQAITVLEAIKSLGSQIAIDDFGKGYSAMSYIGSLPVDCLKIDKAFIDPIGESNEKELVSTIIAIANTHAFKTVAEGVETKQQKDFLESLACDEMQGFYFSKPLPFKEFVKFLEENKH